jgi:hypothetical protein
MENKLDKLFRTIESRALKLELVARYSEGRKKGVDFIDPDTGQMLTVKAGRDKFHKES